NKPLRAWVIFRHRRTHAECAPYQGCHQPRRLALTDQTNPAAEAHDAPDMQDLQTLKTAYDNIKTQIAKVIVGQDEVIEQLLVCIFARGHCMLEGVPGLAKTLLVSTLAKSLSLKFARVQFTPDLMPSDITGTEIIEENR